MDVCVIRVRVPAAESGEPSFQWESGLDAGAARLRLVPPPLRLLRSADLWLLQEL